MAVEPSALTLRDVASILEADEAALVDFVAGVPSEVVPLFALHVTTMRKALDRIEAEAERRMEADQLREWTAPDGVVYQFKGRADWKVSDPEGFVSALRGLLSERDFAKAAKRDWKFSHAALTSLANDLGDAVADVVRDFRERHWGPRHLRPRDER